MSMRDNFADSGVKKAKVRASVLTAKKPAASTSSSSAAAPAATKKPAAAVAASTAPAATGAGEAPSVSAVSSQ